MKIPYLTSKRLANREVAYYFNIPARLIPEDCTIKSQPLGKDYFRAYQKALELFEQLKTFKKTGENINIKSASGLWRLYRESRFYKELAERTKKDYTYAFGLIEKKENKSGQSLASVSLDLFDNDTAYRLYERFVASYKPRWAKNCISFLRMMFNFGTRKNIFTCKNPFENLRIKQIKPKKIFIPAEDIQTLIAKAREMEFACVALAIELNFYICQRPADVLKLRKADLYVKNGAYFFNIIQNKTGANVHVPVPPELLPEILKAKNYIIADDNGHPFNVNAFGRIFKKVNDACGFNYTFRLLRHSGSTAYAEAGVNTSAIIALTGHTDEKIFNTTYKGNSERLSLTAMNKLREYRKETKNK